MPHKEAPEVQADVGVSEQKAKRAVCERNIWTKLQAIVKELAKSHVPRCIEPEAGILRVLK
jgi:hypothetical protein